MNDEKTQEHNAQQQGEVLLALGKIDRKVKAVKGVDEKGNMQSVNPVKRNQNQFMRVDKHGDLFSNFFSNFLSQLRNPSSFDFFKVPADLAVDVATKVNKGLAIQDNSALQQLEKYVVGVEPELNNEKSNNMDNTQNTQEIGSDTQYRYDPKKIDWDMMGDIGLSERELIERNMMEPLLKGYKTNELVPLVLRIGSAEARVDARLSLKTNEVGDVVIAIHGIRKEPNLKYPLFGHEFSDEDKKNCSRQAIWAG